MTGPVPVPPFGKPDNPRCPECRLRWRRAGGAARSARDADRQLLAAAHGIGKR